MIFLKNKNIILLIVLLLASSCIEEFNPVIDKEDIGKYVIFGNITNQEGFQTISVSYSSAINSNEYIPVNDCDIELKDDNGNTFYPSVYNNGEYKIWIPQEYLNIGTAYKIDVITPEGDHITSDYDTLYDCAQLDSVYFERKVIKSDVNFTYENLQFYADMSGLPKNSKYYMYRMVETWEIHTKYAKEKYYDGRHLTIIDPPDSSTHICWKTQSYPNFFLLTTEYLSENKFRQLPLHSVSNRTEKLAYGYSVEVNQMSISNSAYKYFSLLKNSINKQGGLYSTQPEQTKGNLQNITNPGKEVLGYFFTSSVKSKRTFVDKIEDLELSYSHNCSSSIIMGGLSSIPQYELPTYIIGNSYLTRGCVDCRLGGGKLTKPDFWPY